MVKKENTEIKDVDPIKAKAMEADKISTIKVMDPIKDKDREANMKIHKETDTAKVHNMKMMKKLNPLIHLAMLLNAKFSL